MLCVVNLNEENSKLINLMRRTLHTLLLEQTSRVNEIKNVIMN